MIPCFCDGKHKFDMGNVFNFRRDSGSKFFAFGYKKRFDYDEFVSIK